MPRGTHDGISKIGAQIAAAPPAPTVRAVLLHVLMATAAPALNVA
jgi:hypothetical protein